MSHNLTEIDLAYIAGFFDGEGSITIHQNCRPSPRAHAPNHTLQVGIGNTDPQIINLISSNFPGKLIVRQPPSANHRVFYHWMTRAAQSVQFLEAIDPFVRMKKQQVAVALEFQRAKYKRGRNRVPREVLLWREEQRNLLRSLNGRHPVLAKEAKQSVAW